MLLVHDLCYDGIVINVLLDYLASIWLKLLWPLNIFILRASYTGTLNQKTFFLTRRVSTVTVIILIR